MSRLRGASRQRVCVGTLVALAGLVAACGSNDDAASAGEGAAAAITNCDQVDLTQVPAEPVPIRFGTAVGVDANGVLYAIEGVAPSSVRPYAGKWYDMSTTVFRANEDRYTAYQAGDLDGFAATPPSPWVANARGVDAQIVATVAVNKKGGPNDTVGLAQAHDGVASVTDLEGKKLGILDNKSISELYARGAVQVGGHDPDDAEYVVLPFPAQASALRQGQVDVGQSAEPILTGELKKGGVQHIFSSADVVNQLAGGALPEHDLQFVLFGKDFIDEHPEAICAWLSDLTGSARWFKDNVTAARQAFLAKKLVAAPPEAYLSIGPPSLPDEGLPVDVVGMKKMVEIALDTNVIENDQQPNMDTLISPLANTK